MSTSVVYYYALCTIYYKASKEVLTIKILHRNKLQDLQLFLGEHPMGVLEHQEEVEGHGLSYWGAVYQQAWRKTSWK